MPLVDLALGWGRVGLFGFGGGPSMVPLIKAECVDTYGWLDEPRFMELLAASNALPGPVTAKLSVVVGYDVAGPLGALTAFFAVMAPPGLLMFVLGHLLVRHRGAPHLQGALAAAQPVVIAMLAWTAIDLAPTGFVGARSIAVAGLALAALLLRVHPALVITAAMLLGALWFRPQGAP